jgi:hypothetical protein
VIFREGAHRRFCRRGALRGRSLASGSLHRQKLMPLKRRRRYGSARPGEEPRTGTRKAKIELAVVPNTEKNAAARHILGREFRRAVVDLGKLDLDGVEALDQAVKRRVLHLRIVANNPIRFLAWDAVDPTPGPWR